MVGLAKYKKIASVLVIPIVVIGIIEIHTYRMLRVGNSMSKDYSLIEKQDSINDVITIIYFPDGFRSTSSTRLIVLSNGSKRTLFAAEDKFLRSISDVIKVGTIITKQKNNDTVVLINTTGTDTSVYCFRILNSDFK